MPEISQNSTDTLSNGISLTKGGPNFKASIMATNSQYTVQQSTYHKLAYLGGWFW